MTPMHRLPKTECCDKKKDHFPLPFIDQMLESYLVNLIIDFLDGFSRYLQIAIVLENQEKTTFTWPLVHLLIGGCLSGYVMLLSPFKGA